MISLKPITHQNIDDFDGTEYETMTSEQRRTLIEESIGKTHNGAYFEFLVVYREHTVIGFMNLYAHSAHIISCGPTIKEPYRKNGFGCLAETMALEYAKEKGYTIAVGGVEDTNAASIALHEKLGFELDRTFSNKRGKTIRLYIKAL
ncbi:MAG: GNAT family N-acetyltransferase [Clostridia bacterium]|nr:GNAT family N-acetyltransferase [Clostridia bacterium]